MVLFLRALNQLLSKCQAILHLTWVGSGLVSLAFMLMAMAVEGTGGAAFRWLLALTGQASWALAISAAAFFIFEWSLAAAIACSALGFVLRQGLLIQSDVSAATIVRIRQTGMRVNRMPVMALQLRVDRAGGPVMASVKKLMDLGNIPRAGDRIRVAVSRIDPTCVRYLGPA